MDEQSMLPTCKPKTSRSLLLTRLEICSGKDFFPSVSRHQRPTRQRVEMVRDCLRPTKRKVSAGSFHRRISTTVINHVSFVIGTAVRMDANGMSRRMLQAV